MKGQSKTTTRTVNYRIKRKDGLYLTNNPTGPNTKGWTNKTFATKFRSTNKTAEALARKYNNCFVEEF